MYIVRTLETSINLETDLISEETEWNFVKIKTRWEIHVSNSSYWR